MNKFHQIPTDQYVPISHDNSYLFNHYDKVANFLAFNLERNFKNILAKPVQNGYNFDWFSPYENLTNSNSKDKEASESSLITYWEFIDVINKKIDQLRNLSDENSKNWAELLTKVFNQQDNIIFSNGTNISIVWGWKFDNNQIYKPNLTSKQNLKPELNQDILDTEEVEENNEINYNDNSGIEDNNEINEIPEFEPEDEVVEDEVVEEELVEEEMDEVETPIIEKRSFLEFLKWFASNYWWLLLILITLILIIFFVKSIIYSN